MLRIGNLLLNGALDNNSFDSFEGNLGKYVRKDWKDMMIVLFEVGLEEL